MSRAKGHHQTPQAYLRQFADADGFVQIYDRITGASWRQHVREVAVVNNLYTFVDVDGNPSDAFETGPLQRIDGKVAVLLPKLLEPTPRLTIRNRVDVNAFIVIQVGRTPGFRDFLADSHDLMLRLEVESSVGGAPPDEVERFIEQRFPDAIESGKEEIRRIAADPTQPAKLPTIDWINAVVGNLRPSLDVVCERPWAFVDAVGDDFLTADNPVVMIGPPPAGLETAIMIHWPLSPRRALWLALAGTRDKYIIGRGRAQADFVAELNQLTADQASRQIIWHPDTNPIANIQLPTGPLLQSVNGMPIAPGESIYDKIRPQWDHMFEVMKARRAQRSGEAK